MGYYIKSKKINIVLDEQQQEAIFNIWKNLPTLIKDKKEQMLLRDFVFLFSECESCEDLLKELHFEIRRTKKGLKLVSYSDKLRNQEKLFDLVGDILTPGSFMTLKGEDGDIFGWFFNGKRIYFDGYKELKELNLSFEQKKALDDTLKEIPINKTFKI